MTPEQLELRKANVRAVLILALLAAGAGLLIAEPVVWIFAGLLAITAGILHLQAKGAPTREP